jgi:hypothetical protein
MRFDAQADEEINLLCICNELQSNKHIHISYGIILYDHQVMRAKAWGSNKFENKCSPQKWPGFYRTHDLIGSHTICYEN